MKPVPSWWCQSELVVGLAGEQGILSVQDGSWTVHLENHETAFINPDPDYWHKRPVPQIGTMQLRRILYEADRAYVASCGRSAQTEWISVPESKRTGLETPRCTPLDETQQSSIRRLIEHALLTALSPYEKKF